MTHNHDRQTILVVDDVPAEIDMFSEMLRSEYMVKATVEGEKALEIAKIKPPPDLILLDIMMPRMDGYEVCRRLKDNDQTKDIPVIFVTAKGEVDNETKGLALGAVDYITKPVSPPIVKARIRNHLKLKDQHDQLKESISIMQHEAEILQQKADLGIQAGGLAHDINNILYGCMYVQMIPNIMPDEYPQKEMVEDFVNSVMESIQLGKEVCQGYTSYLRDLGEDASYQEIVRLLQPLDMYAREYKGEIIRELADDLPEIFCKGYQIKRVFVNLFTNASQAIENQDEQLITIRAWVEGGSVFFSMRDNGPGIPADILPNIFKERFTTKDNGTGLGLFMVKEIIDSHKGTIEVDTEAGKGTIFTISLPVAQGQNDTKENGRKLGGKGP